MHKFTEIRFQKQVLFAGTVWTQELPVISQMDGQGIKETGLIIAGAGWGSWAGDGREFAVFGVIDVDREKRALSAARTARVFRVANILGHVRNFAKGLIKAARFQDFRIIPGLNAFWIFRLRDVLGQIVQDGLKRWLGYPDDGVAAVAGRPLSAEPAFRHIAAKSHDMQVYVPVAGASGYFDDQDAAKDVAFPKDTLTETAEAGDETVGCSRNVRHIAHS
jgi:hypothetical protein